MSKKEDRQKKDQALQTRLLEIEMENELMVGFYTVLLAVSISGMFSITINEYYAESKFGLLTLLLFIGFVLMTILSYVWLTRAKKILDNKLTKLKTDYDIE